MPAESKNTHRTNKFSPIAIIGMSCLFPGSPDLSTFWANLVAGQSEIREATPSEWDSERYSHRSTDEYGAIYCTRGGFITDMAEFNPIEHGVMPKAVNGADPDQFIALSLAKKAIRDAGYLERDFDRGRASVVLGRIAAPGSGAVNLIQHGFVDQIVDVLSSAHSELSEQQLETIRHELTAQLQPCNSDTIPGVMPNILAGRIAANLGWEGKTLVLDAACASSLVALEIACDELHTGRCDMVLSGGIHINSSSYFYQMFCGIKALSPTGVIRPFDNSADGTLLGEGAGMVVLKRLDDAIADGDNIYAIIRGIGSSSNGHGSSVLAPSISGEALAMRRAYESAGISPRTIGLMEAHGTATKSGDETELRAIEEVFEECRPSTLSASPDGPWCALGSVKSNIGHCQSASGIAGVIKAAMALRHKIIPPTLNVSQPTEKVDWKKFPCYLSTRARPWIHPWMHESLRGKGRSHLFSETSQSADHFPRRAAVSAFGFGGINSHIILEEYADAQDVSQDSLCSWDSELILFTADASESLCGKVESLLASLRKNSDNKQFTLENIAYTVNTEFLEKSGTTPGSSPPNPNEWTLAIVAGSITDLISKLTTASQGLRNGNLKQFDFQAPIIDGIYLYFGDNSIQGKIAYVLPGLGAAYPYMLKDLCFHFPEVREVFDFVDRLALNIGEANLPGSNVFPSSAESSALALAQANSAVVTVLMAEWALHALLQKLGVTPDMVVGCSTGEFAAMSISGIVDIVAVAEVFYGMTTAVARSIPADEAKSLRTLTVKAAFSEISRHLESLPVPVYLSTQLTPNRSIITGEKSVVDQATKILDTHGIEYQRLPIAIPYHTPLVKDVLKTDQSTLESVPMKASDLPAWSCSTMERFPDALDEIRNISTGLFKSPVRLSETIEKMYEDGARIFVELGPKGGLTSFISETLTNKNHLAITCDVPNRSSITQLNHLLAVLICSGKSVDLNHLYRGRKLNEIDLIAGTDADTCTPRLSLAYPVTGSSALINNIINDGSTYIPAEPEPQFEQEISLQNEESNEARTMVGMSAIPQNRSTREEDVHLHLRYESRDTEVLSNYLDSLTEFHQKMTAMQQRVMIAYLDSEEEN